MKISIWTNGDPSVGINGQSAEVEIIGGEWIDEQEYREEVREILGNAFHEIFDDGFLTVAFEDELQSEDPETVEESC